MRNRGDRRFRKAQIKKRLIEQAIRRHNSSAGLHFLGSYTPPIVRWEELPREGWYGIRHVLRNEGKARERVYRCGVASCDWCAGNLRHKYKRQEAAMASELATWFEWADVDSESSTQVSDSQTT